MSKTGLILEGGGMRGAYTAGALSVLAENNIRCPYNVGMSIASIYLCAYLSGNTELMRYLSVNCAGEKGIVGIRALFSEGNLVAYDHLFERLKNYEKPLDIEKLKSIPEEVEFGVYDLVKGQTEWIGKDRIEEDLLYFRAACTLPFYAKKVNIHGTDYMDGGLTTMIPVFHAQEKGCDRFVVITTKPGDYVRKPYGKPVQALLKAMYPESPGLIRDIRERTVYYYNERDFIENAVKKNKCFYMFPTRPSKVSRFGGSEEALAEFYEMGREDMQARKDELVEFLHG